MKRAGINPSLSRVYNVCVCLLSVRVCVCLFTTSTAAGSKQNLKVILAVLAPFMLTWRRERKYIYIYIYMLLFAIVDQTS